MLSIIVFVFRGGRCCASSGSQSQLDAPFWNTTQVEPEGQIDPGIDNVTYFYVREADIDETETSFLAAQNY